MTSEINDIPFIELINNKASIHKKSIQMLLIAVYKNLNGLSQPIILGLFTTRDNIYNLRSFRELYFEKMKTIGYGTETVTYKAAQLWELLPYDIKNSPISIAFKARRETWNQIKLPLPFM